MTANSFLLIFVSTCKMFIVTIFITDFIKESINMTLLVGFLRTVGGGGGGGIVVSISTS